jgi:hypothetical protein
MDPRIVTYLIYLPLGIGLTVWVASVLSRHGKVFLSDVFNQDEHLVVAVNQLLVVGFYLVNTGFVALWLRTGDAISDSGDVIEVLARKLGIVALVLGGVHLVNVWIFSKIRRRRVDEQFLRDQRGDPIAVEPAPPVR